MMTMIDKLTWVIRGTYKCLQRNEELCHPIKMERLAIMSTLFGDEDVISLVKNACGDADKLPEDFVKYYRQVDGDKPYEVIILNLLHTVLNPTKDNPFWRVYETRGQELHTGFTARYGRLCKVVGPVYLEVNPARQDDSKFIEVSFFGSKLFLYLDADVETTTCMQLSTEVAKLVNWVLE